eukprot:COSAG02_NODE_2944_length_7689_cov_9.378920_6_plen_125_part_00
MAARAVTCCFKSSGASATAIANRAFAWSCIFIACCRSRCRSWELFFLRAPGLLAVFDRPNSRGLCKEDQRAYGLPWFRNEVMRLIATLAAEASGHALEDKVAHHKVGHILSRYFEVIDSGVKKI